jgi:hypothetical protein
MRILTILCITLTTSACFTYRPVATTIVRPDEEVRVRITDDAALRLAGHYGAITQRLEGQLAPTDSDSLMLAIWIGRAYTGTSFENARQRLSLGRQEVVEVRRRQFSLSRTAIVAAGIVGVAAYVVNRTVFMENPNPNPTTPRGDVPDPDAFTTRRR